MKRRVGAADRLRRLAAEVATMPVLDDRPIAELLDYDDRGLPT
jgi:hypothetical protein